MKVLEGEVHVNYICLSYFKSPAIETTPSPEVHSFRELAPSTLEFWFVNL